MQQLITQSQRPRRNNLRGGKIVNLLSRLTRIRHTCYDFRKIRTGMKGSSKVGICYDEVWLLLFLS